MTELQAKNTIAAVCDLYLSTLKTYTIERVEIESISGNRAQYVANFAVICKDNLAPQALIADLMKLYSSDGGGFIEFLGVNRELGDVNFDVIRLSAIVDAFQI